MAWGYLIWSLPYVLLTWYVLFHCGGRAQHGHSPTLHCIALHWHVQLQKDFIIFHEHI